MRMAPPCCLFDFDGVLVNGDSFALFMLRAGAVGWRRVTGFVAVLAVAPLALFPGQRSRAIRLVVRAALLGMSPEQLQQRTAAFGKALAYEPGRVVQDAVAAIQEHLAAGHRVVVVTASEETLARAFLDALGMTDVELVASQVHGQGLNNRGPVKVRQLEGRGIRPQWEVAYTDSLMDLPILLGARRAVLVNVSPRTLARARAILGDRVDVVTWH
jgi:phosphatidylglycerophosphatase C